MRAMKDSGIPWIGEIPQNWGRCEIKYYCTAVFPGATPSTSNPKYWDGIIPWIPSGSCHDKKITEAPKTITEAGLANSSTKLIPANTALVAMTGATCGNTGYLTFESCANQSVTAFIEDKRRCYSVYLWYLLQAAKVYLLTFQTGGAQAGVNVENCKNLWVPYVPLAEQVRIAAFLDLECARIDKVMEQTRASVEEYKKLKQSIITEAVTKGIRPNRPMKDSGIDWIGQIAQDYQLMKLKHVFEILDQYRSPITADQRNQSAEVLYDYYGASGAIDKIDGYTIDDHVMLIGEDGANLRMRNLPLMYEVNGKAWINNHAHILKPKDGMDFYYFFYALESLDINPYITGSAQPKLSQESLKNMWIPVPSYEEQKEIAAYLKTVISRFETIIERKMRFLYEMESYKKSLVFEYVTGKKEVNDAI